MHQSLRCLVTGSTGYIGGRLVPRLLSAGHQVRALARNPGKLTAVPWLSHVEVVRGDLSDANSLIAACTGVDVVYYLVHSMGAARNFAAEESRAAANVAAAAKRTGVQRIVYLSGLHQDSAKLSPHLASRQAVADVLLASGVETVVLQAGVVVGSGSASFEMIRHLTDRLPVMTTPKWVHNKIQPIAIGDALYYLMAAATANVPASGSWDIGGPDVLEYGDMMRTYAEVARLGKRYLIVLPFLTPTIASLWVGTVTPIPSGLARPLIESLECDAVMRDHAVDSIIPAPADGLADYREAVRLALERGVQGRADATWDSSDRPADALPSDPSWAGEIVYTDVRVKVTTADPELVWKAVEQVPSLSGGGYFPLALRRSGSVGRWNVHDDDAGRILRLRAATRAPGQAWLEFSVTPHDESGSRYLQRANFFPRGLVGRVYWAALRPLHVVALRALARKVVALAQ